MPRDKVSAARILLDSAIGGVLGAGGGAFTGAAGAHIYNLLAPGDWELDAGDMARYGAMTGAGNAILNRAIPNIQGMVSR